jgi:hypothetical protein
MKKNKRRINTFKNWLLARDSASRIAPVSKYYSFLENEGAPELSRREILAIFDTIDDSSTFYKLHKLFDYEKYKDAGKKEFKLSTNYKNSSSEIRSFINCLSPTRWDSRNEMVITLDPQISEPLFSDEKSEDNLTTRGRVIRLSIPMTYSKKQILEECFKLVDRWIDGSNWGEKYKTDFFKYWMKAFLFTGGKYDNFQKSFESSFVEWLRVAAKDDASQAYLDLLNNSKNDKLGIKDIVDHVNQGIKEFGIDLNGIEKGYRLLSRFGS